MFWFTKKAIVAACGTTSTSSSSRFDSDFIVWDTHARHVGAGSVEALDKAEPTGSLPLENTTGIVVVAAFAAPSREFPKATIAATLRSMIGCQR